MANSITAETGPDVCRQITERRKEMVVVEPKKPLYFFEEMVHLCNISELPKLSLVFTRENVSRFKKKKKNKKTFMPYY